MGHAKTAEDRTTTQPVGLAASVLDVMDAPESFDEVFGTQYPRLARALAVAEDAAHAEDAVQEAFILAEHRLHGARDRVDARRGAWELWLEPYWEGSRLRMRYDPTAGEVVDVRTVYEGRAPEDEPGAVIPPDHPEGDEILEP